MGIEFEAGTTGSSFDGARRESAYTDGDRILFSTDGVGSTTMTAWGTA